MKRFLSQNVSHDHERSNFSDGKKEITFLTAQYLILKSTSTIITVTKPNLDHLDAKKATSKFRPRNNRSRYLSISMILVHASVSRPRSICSSSLSPGRAFYPKYLSPTHPSSKILLKHSSSFRRGYHHSHAKDENRRKP